MGHKADTGFSSQGTVTSCDGLFAHLHGFASGEEVVGQRITDLIPSLQLPASGEHIPTVGPQGGTRDTGAAWLRLGPVAAGVSLSCVGRVLRPSFMS